jgi:hypothetical protein
MIDVARNYVAYHNVLSIVWVNRITHGQVEGKRNVVDLYEQSAVDICKFFSIVRIVNDAKFNLSNQPYLH